MIDSGLVGREVSRGEKLALRGTDPESYITEYTLVYEKQLHDCVLDEPRVGKLRDCECDEPLVENWAMV